MAKTDSIIDEILHLPRESRAPARVGLTCANRLSFASDILHTGSWLLPSDLACLTCSSGRLFSCRNGHTRARRRQTSG
jgi:hypothetical protein